MLALWSRIAGLGMATGGLAVWRDDDLMAPLLILLLGIALGVCMAGLLAMLHLLRSGRLNTRRAAEPHSGRKARGRHAPPPSQSNSPMRWLAVKSAHPQVVQATLRLHNPIPCSWEEGLSVAHERKLFISPPINGWVLVLGLNLPEPAQDVDKCFRFLLDLSHKLGHVQFFSLNRAWHHHAWVQAEDGRIVRAYAWAGKTLWHQGKLTRAELDLGLQCFDYAEPPERLRPEHVAAIAANLERLPRLAARWSVDPAAINGRLLRESQGIAGEFSRSKIH